MASPDEFEPFIKMNRIAPPSVLSGPLPVKFREVVFDPSYNSGDTQSKTQTVGDAVQIPLTGHIFFKDPLCPPDLIVEDENEADSEEMFAKLGRNMRASHPQIGNRRKTDVRDLMNERRKLLDQQKEQHTEFSKQADSEQQAAVLVNDLLQNGFHITPPEQTPRGSPEGSLGSRSHRDDEKVERPEVDEGRLVRAIHKEMKRITGGDIIEPEEEQVPS